MSSRARRAKGDGAAGCIVLLVVAVPIVVVLVAVGLAVFSATGGSDPTIDGVAATDLLPSSGDLLVLPGALDDDPTVVTMASPVGGGGRVVALVELEEGPVWQAEIVPDDVYSAQFVATDDVVLASLGREVVALDRATGEVGWEAEASDEVDPSCSACFALVDGTLVVLGRDGEVTAFDPAGGEVLWSHRFTSPAGRVVPFGDAVLLVDDPPADDDQASLSMTLVRPSDGSELSRFAPGCTDPEFGDPLSASLRLPIVAIPGTDDIVIAYGTYAGCVQRWTVTTGEQRWSRPTEARLDAYDAADRAWALGPSDLVLATDDGWLVVGLAEGGLTPVAAPPDTQPSSTVVVSGDRFVAAVSSTRGSAEWSLEARDLRRGDPLWTRELGPDHEPAEVGPESSTQSVYDGTIFTVLAVDDQLRLLTIGPPGPRFELQELDPDTGEGEIAGVAPVRTDSPTSVGARIDVVRDGQALVDADGVLQVLDLATGEVGVAWGR
jgi:outer membrane protein assembly factor BamB